MSEWISVTDKMPYPGEIVPVIWKFQTLYAFFNLRSWVFHSFENIVFHNVLVDIKTGDKLDGVTHWLKLPHFPGEVFAEMDAVTMEKIHRDELRRSGCDIFVRKSSGRLNE
jgi:hypothetical protein